MLVIKLHESWMTIEKSVYKEKNDAVRNHLKGFDITTNIQGDIVVHGTHEQLYQALLNLLKTYDVTLE